MPLPEPALQTATVTAIVLNVRSGPGVQYGRIGTVRAGNSVAVLAKSGLWLKIDFNGLDAWVHGDYVKLNAPVPAPLPIPSPVNEPARLDVVAEIERIAVSNRDRVTNADRKNEWDRVVGYAVKRRTELS